MSAQDANPGTVLKHLQHLANGLASKPPGGQTSLVIEGVSVTVADLVTELGGYAAAYQAVDDADTEHKRALVARAAIEDRARRRRDTVRGAIKGALGKTNPDLTSYGITPDRDPRPLTVEEETLKVAKAKATRAARHTMGKRQKEAIKGQVAPKAGSSEA